MALATYKDLCIDAMDPEVMGRFWAGALDLDLELLDDGDAKLSGPTPRHTVWINRVPEPLTAKQRMHLDVWADTDEEIETLGATLVDAGSFPWRVMKDPEGGELCVFSTTGGRRPGLMEVVVDTASVESARVTAAWWSDVLGGTAADHEEHGFSYVEAIPGAPFDDLVFVPVPEPKTVKNRIHIDVVTPDLEALLANGAVLLRPQDDEIGWNVMADPDGNEFCAFVR